MCYIFECIVIIVTFSLVWTALLLLFHRCPFSFNNQVHTGRFCSSFCLVVLAVDHSYRYLYTVCMRCCVCVFAILIWEWQWKIAFEHFNQQKDLLCSLHWHLYSCTNHLVYSMIVFNCVCMCRLSLYFIQPYDSQSVYVWFV